MNSQFYYIEGLAMIATDYMQECWQQGMQATMHWDEELHGWVVSVQEGE